MRVRSFAMFILGIVVALAIGGVAYATDGFSVLLGRTNSATRVTTIRNPYGSALSLVSRAGSAPLRVNSATKVPSLNADLLDGIDSAAFARTTGATGIIVGSAADDDGLANTAHCPAGSIATGGGGFAAGPRDYLNYSGPDHGDDGRIVPNSWLVVADSEATAWAVCYNPRGAVPGAATHVSAVP